MIIVDQVLKAEADGVALEEILTLMTGGKGKVSYESGDTEIAPIACGQIAGMIQDIKPVDRIISDIISEAETLLDRLHEMVI